VRYKGYNMDNGQKKLDARTIEIQADDLAAAFGYTSTQFMRELSLWGWTMIMNEAERLACVDRWNHNATLPQKDRTRDVNVTWDNIRDATQQFIPSKLDNPVLVNRHAGWLYVLYDADAGLCKIGCTTGDDCKRQRTLIRSHGHPLVNLLNAKVANRFVAEKQCHRHFQHCRRNGEWFAVKPEDLVAYIEEQIDWLHLDKNC
jgi:hypothetical protein